MAKQDTIIHNMTQGSVLREILRFAMPLMLANFLQTAYNLVDSAIVGQFVGAEALAAVVGTGEIMNLFTLIGMGFGSAGQIILAQQVGKNDHRGISTSVGTLFTTMLFLSLLFSVIVLTGADWMLRILNIPAESLFYARRYLLVCGSGLVFIFGYNAVGHILRGMGDSRRPLVFVAIAAGMNCVLDLLFVVAFRWDTLGAALATVLGQAASFLISLLYLYRRRESFSFDFRFRSFIPTKDSLHLVLKVGIPQATQFAAMVLSSLYITSLINGFGVAAAAVSGVAMKLENICRVVTNSMSVSVGSMFAQCVGAGKLDRCKTSIRCGFWICMVYCALCAVCIGFFPEGVFSLFSGDAAVLSLAHGYALVGVAICLGNALRNTFLPSVVGVGNASLSMLIGILEGVVGRIGFSLLFGIALNMGVPGFWWGTCLAGYIPVVICMFYYYSGRWKSYRLL